jgi:hypothetical protein
MPTTKATRNPKVTKADLARAAEFMRALGLTPLSIDVMPGRVRIVTKQGDFELSRDSELDQEHAAFRTRNGYG